MLSKINSVYYNHSRILLSHPLLTPTDKGLEIITDAKVCCSNSQKKKQSNKRFFLGRKIYHYYSKCHQKESALKINTIPYNYT